jgi:hypothetical protein
MTFFVVRKRRPAVASEETQSGRGHTTVTDARRRPRAWALRAGDDQHGPAGRRTVDETNSNSTWGTSWPGGGTPASVAWRWMALLRAVANQLV